MAMTMNYKQFQELAMKNYTKGGDCVVECWDELSFRYYCEEFGPMTKEKADLSLKISTNWYFFPSGFQVCLFSFSGVS